jgi:hypothetical protein
MTLLQQAVTAITELSTLAKGFRTGEIPNPNLILGIQADILDLHMQLGQEMAQKFGTKEQSYLARKIAEATHYKSDRMDIERKLAASDCQKYAILAVTTESTEEIRSAMEYEQYRAMLKSLQNAFDYARSLVSFIGKSERNT